MKDAVIKKCASQKRILKLIDELFPDAEPKLEETDVYFVAVLEEEDIGFLHLGQRRGKITLEGVGVKEKYRGEGLGSRLLDTAITVAERSGKDIILKVKPENAVALNLYAKKGFAIKRLRSVYILQRKLCT